MSGLVGGARIELPEDLVDQIAARAAEILQERVPDQVQAASPWLTLDDAAEYLRTSTRTIHRKVKKGVLRPSYGTGRPLFHVSDLDKAAAGEETAPTVPPRRRED